MILMCELYFPLQVKYKEDGKKELSVNLFSLLPETLDTQHAKELAEMQSEVGAICCLQAGCIKYWIYTALYLKWYASFTKNLWKLQPASFLFETGSAH